MSLKKKNSLRTLLNKNSKYCKETVKLRTFNVFTVKKIDYMYRMALEKDNFRTGFSVTLILEFRVTGNWFAARVASRVKMGL